MYQGDKHHKKHFKTTVLKKKKKNQTTNGLHAGIPTYPNRCTHMPQITPFINLRFIQDPHKDGPDSFKSGTTPEINTTEIKSRISQPLIKGAFPPISSHTPKSKRHSLSLSFSLSLSLTRKKVENPKNSIRFYIKKIKEREKYSENK